MRNLLERKEMMPNADWIARQEDCEDSRREYERERLIIWTLDSLADLLQEGGITKADVARRLGTSRAHITQLFSGSRNATLSTVSDVAWACGKRALVKFEPLRSGQFISQPTSLVSTKSNVAKFWQNPEESRPFLRAGGSR